MGIQIIDTGSPDAGRTNLTLARSGDQPTYVGGSSAATTTTAGVAALVWSRSPQLSRQAVLERLRNTASVYPGRDPNFGRDAIDAAAAVAANQSPYRRRRRCP